MDYIDKSTARALDANLNRAAEGIRVCEDVLRFGESLDLSVKFKEARHALAQGAAAWSGTLLVTARDVEGDHQKFADLASEHTRTSPEGLFRANIKRAQEALRCIEEFSKLAYGSGAAFQEIRFNLYSLEKEALLYFSRSTLMGKFGGLYAIVDSAFVRGGEYALCAEKLIRGGAKVVQLRMKGEPDIITLAMAREVRAVCTRMQALFIMNDAPHIAVLAGADGLHLGQDDIPVAEARALTGGAMIIGKSTISAAEARAALAEGPDYIAIGPVYATSSKNGEPLQGTGLDVVREVTRLSTVPVVAIGGIRTDSVAELKDAGISCVSVISALFAGGRLEENAASFVKLLN